MPTPASLGFSMPAEWHDHSATWLAWPKNELTFPPRILPRVEQTFLQMINAISQGERCNVLLDSMQEMEKTDKLITKAGANTENVVLHQIPSADVWIRDWGPNFLINRRGGKAAVKWEFNAWGNKYVDLLPDNKTGEEVAKASSAQIFRPNIVMEGGSIDCNGAGAFLTTKQCLLNKNRNPQLGQVQIEQYLADYLGARRAVWLADGIEGDDTDGHVDDFARFVSGKAVVCCQEKNESDKNHKPLADAKKALLDSGFEVVDLPMPTPLADPEENRRLPASHANFYACNKSILVPAFGGESDTAAKEILEGCFSGREAVLINSKELVFGYGGIHCATQQEPKSLS